MTYTPRTCPGPGDLWQPSWQEEKREAEYERLLEKFFEEYIPRHCDERINQLAEAGEEVKPEDVIDINAVTVEDFKDIEDGEVVGTSQDAPAN